MKGRVARSGRDRKREKETGKETRRDWAGGERDGKVSYNFSEVSYNFSAFAF